jgi:hypothetical protein
MVCLNNVHSWQSLDLLDPGFTWNISHGTGIISPTPGITKPKSGKNITIGGFRSAVCYGDLDQNVVRVRFGVFYKNIEIAVFLKYAGIGQIVFKIG